jgi:type IV pilus assembly protein PilX
MMALAYSSISRPQKQRGAALIVSLVFLLILTIISVASLQTATMQERMAGNMKDTTIAFQAAEAALRNAEIDINTGAIGVFNGANGRYLSCPDPDDKRSACAKPDWTDYESQGWKSQPKKVPDVVKQPEYVILQLNRAASKDAVLDSDKPVARDGFFKIIARGYGVSDRSMVVLSTTFKRKE